ncbi:aminopeptidase P family protein [Tahibacter soli]|uniref:Aminopeptidase P family protein n=1 Tax=Tahibacter soli TaxID=2983605 RepID=A0A9X4BJN1_9GAMM|nr:aminopeptidase P family protein [Tahibacter soli]MDC8015281.1 aminopeptidase P family protein [Tahibacter soli]
MPICAILNAVRTAMREHGVAAVVVPSADPHSSEYLPARWKTRERLSGFTGSAGTLVVTHETAFLATDSRYFEQAERELAGSGIDLFKLARPGVPEHYDRLAATLARGDVVAVAGDVLSLAQQAALEQRFGPAGIVLRTDLDLAGCVWTDRPPLPDSPVREHRPEFAGDRGERLARVRRAIAQAGATHHLVSSLDDIAWIASLRGTDVPYNPVFVAHLLLSPERATLFVGADKIGTDKIGAELAARLAADGIDLAGYAEAGAALAALPAGARLLVDPQRTVKALADAVPAGVALVRAPNPSQRFKAAKTDAELAHVRGTMRKDGAALVRFLIWLEETVGTRRLTELDVAAKLEELRGAQPDYAGASFATIAGYQANGALPHYRATGDHHAALAPEGLLLVDSGGQYEGGTTDVTRTIALGETTAQQRLDYTLVLKGMIALSRAWFPAGTTGQQLDALARAPLWAHGLNYGHGTGHGVGFFLNVHEGPQAIRPPLAGETAEPLAPGMIVSNEPGLYRPGRHGIRIENLIVATPAAHGEFGQFLRFETLTLCPIDGRPIVADALDAAERGWLNAYHATVRERLSPLLDDHEREWLARRCAPL